MQIVIFWFVTTCRQMTVFRVRVVSVHETTQCHDREGTYWHLT